MTMWIPGLFLGPAAIIGGIMAILNADRLARQFKRGSALIGDDPDRYTAGRMMAPSVMAIGIGVVVILLSLFGHPVP